MRVDFRGPSPRDHQPFVAAAAILTQSMVVPGAEQKSGHRSRVRQ
jgi:hypothetical protein